ncbi:phenylacetate--CoA ligase family protein [Leptospira idonii]|uniref:Phenylacetate--CoA ligase family protein n=2 Tax=Leptospira idonii TaxID=1193500 RepID=A0A4R9M664_9LEPT|nr:phenylacetate--CoA ligase family protein [Leptospira idonii]
MREEWFLSLEKMIDSDFAPNWNAWIGDRITQEDYRFVKEFESSVYSKKEVPSSVPPPWLILKIQKLKFTSSYFYERLNGISLPEEFHKIPLMTREDLQNKITEILPTDVDFSRLVVNPTSGTTGKPILAPNHPKAIGCYVPLIEYSLSRHGVELKKGHDHTAAIQLCHQNQTIVYATSHSLAEGSLFAKINLKEKEWKEKDHLQKFISHFQPQFLSGDPYAFETAMKMNLKYSPSALHSTALELEDNLRIALSDFFKCPVVNFYSLNETGPIAYSCPVHPDWMHIISEDLFIEVLDKEGFPAKEGEILISGGRNPYLPLLRYATGDWGEIQYGSCRCGDSFPKLKLLKGRKPVYFEDTKGERINPIDVSRILRKEPNILRHQFIQKKDGSYELNLSVYVPAQTEFIQKLESEFKSLLGSDADIRIKTDLPSDSGKIPVFLNETKEEKN